MISRRSICLAAAVLLALAPDAVAQRPPESPMRLLTAQGARTLPTVEVGDVEMVALEELAAVFPMTAKEDPVTRAINVQWRGQSIVLTPDQSLASAGGRLISLPAAPRRIRDRWHVPVEFIARALAPNADPRIELRKASRLVIVGNLAVPRLMVRHEAPGTQARLTIDISPPAPHTVAQQGDRLVVRFQAQAIDPTIAPFTAREFIRGVRPAPNAPELVIELGPKFGSFRTSTLPSGGALERLVIDVFPSADTTDSATPSAPAAPDLPPLVQATAAGLRTIVIDPGHGGDETGARGPGGTLEKDVTLAVARRLKAAVESRLGLRVLLTRDDDRTVPMDERAALANNNKADLFISLHANAAAGGVASGAEVFYVSLEPQGEEAKRMAEAERASMPVFGGGTRDIDIMLWEVAQARYVDQSSRLASLVAQELRRVIPMSPEPIQRGPFRVLVGANMPAVLVELGYLSNRAQEELLRSSEFPGRAAQALLGAIVRFDAAVRARADASTPLTAETASP